MKAEGFSCILDVLRGGLGINAVLRSRDVYFRSRILIFIHPGSRIPDLGSPIQKQQQKRESAEEKNLGKFSKNYTTFYQKNCQKAPKNMVLGSGIRDPGSEIRDPRSGIRKKPIPDPGSRGQKAPNPGSRIPDPGSGSATLVFRPPGSGSFFY